MLTSGSSTAFCVLVVGLSLLSVETMRVRSASSQTNASSPVHTIDVAVYSPPSRWSFIEKFLQSPTVNRQLDVLDRDGKRLKISIVLHMFSHNFRRDNITFTNLVALNEQVKQIAQCSFIVGRYDPFVQLVADYQRVPYISTSMPVTGDKEPPSKPTHTFRLMPTDSVLRTAVLDVVARMMWVDIAILYDTYRGLDLLGQVIELSVTSVRAWRVSTEQADNELRDKLLDIRQLQIRVVIVACNDQQLLSRIFATALRLSMLTQKYSWLLADTNGFLLNYDLYNDTQVNLTTFNLVDPDSLPVAGNSGTGATTSGTGTGGSGMGRRPTSPRAPDDPVFMSTLTGGLPINKSDIQHFAVVRDSMTIVRSSIEKWFARNVLACPPNCSSELVLPGDELADIIRNTPVNGLTGQINFNSLGRRHNNTLRVMSLMSTSFRQVGSWFEGHNTTGQRLRISVMSENKKLTYRLPPLGRQIVRIVTLEDPPFVMKRPGNTSYGNDRFEGFLIDLIAAIAKELKFKYELYEVPDGSYGGLNANGDWNGMMKELIVGNASMSLGAISITSLRETVVDFSKPFKQKKFNFLMKKPLAQHSVFQFLWPFSSYVWLIILASIIVVSLFLFVVDRINPNSWKLEERFTFHESLFFIYGTLVGPGTNMFPRTLSGRILAGAWWFVALILVASYTANLAAFLTVTRIETPIKNVADLASQRQVRYGTVKNTYAMSMFSKSELPLFKKMWQFMEIIDPNSMVDNTTEGIRKVREGDYAFIWDEPINKYIAMKECDLMAVGEPFDEKGYGIGVPMGASYRDDLTMVILALGERGEIKRLEDRWWTAGDCDEFKDAATVTQELDIRNLAGVFFVLILGIVIALVVCIIEFTVKLYSRSPTEPHKSSSAAYVPAQQPTENTLSMTVL